MRTVATCVLVLLAAPVSAQQINLQSLDKLAARATSKTEVNLDSTMLKFASGFLGDGDSEEAAAKKLVVGLKGVYVRVYEFERVGAYTGADLQAVRDQVRGSPWKPIVSSHDKDEDIDILVRQEGDTTTGMVIIASEPKELTVVNIIGPLRPEDLTALGGQFGIPKIEPKKKE